MPNRALGVGREGGKSVGESVGWKSERRREKQESCAVSESASVV